MMHVDKARKSSQEYFLGAPQCPQQRSLDVLGLYLKCIRRYFPERTQWLQSGRMKRTLTPCRGRPSGVYTRGYSSLVINAHSSCIVIITWDVVQGHLRSFKTTTAKGVHLLRHIWHQYVQYTTSTKPKRGNRYSPVCLSVCLSVCHIVV